MWAENRRARVATLRASSSTNLRVTGPRDTGWPARLGAVGAVRARPGRRCTMVGAIRTGSRLSDEAVRQQTRTPLFRL